MWIDERTSFVLCAAGVLYTSNRPLRQSVFRPARQFESCPLSAAHAGCVGDRQRVCAGQYRAARRFRGHRRRSRCGVSGRRFAALRPGVSADGVSCMAIGNCRRPAPGPFCPAGGAQEPVRAVRWPARIIGARRDPEMLRSLRRGHRRDRLRDCPECGRRLRSASARGAARGARSLCRCVPD